MRRKAVVRILLVCLMLGIILISISVCVAKESTSLSPTPFMNVELKDLRYDEVDGTGMVEGGSEVSIKVVLTNISKELDESTFSFQSELVGAGGHVSVDGQSAEALQSGSSYTLKHKQVDKEVAVGWSGEAPEVGKRAAFTLLNVIQETTEGEYLVVEIKIDVTSQTIEDVIIAVDNATREIEKASAAIADAEDAGLNVAGAKESLVLANEYLNNSQQLYYEGRSEEALVDAEKALDSAKEAEAKAESATPAPEISISPLYLIGAAAVIVIILIVGIGISRKRKRGKSTKPQPPTEPPKPETEPAKQKPSRSRKLNRKTLSELSKLMAYILRHDKKQKFRVDLDENCYAKVDQLVNAISSIGKWRWVNRKHIEEVAAKSFYRGKRRFVIKEDKIKATTYRVTRNCPSTPTPTPKPTPSPSLEQKVKEEQISSPMPGLISIERAIYDPCKRDFIEGRLPRMKEWVNRYDPGAYWFAISVQNDTDRAIEEWGVELEFSSALKVKEAKIEGIEIEIPSESHLGIFKISVPKEYGIVIPKGGAQRVYFKLRAEKPKTTYEVSGIFKSVFGEVLIRAKEFKYLCDTGVSPGAVKAELKKTFSEKDAARLALSFKTVQELDKMCDQEAKTEEYLNKLSSLKGYTEGFSDTFTKHLEEFSRFMKQEQLEYLDDAYKGKVKRFCTNLVDVWISEFLKW